MVESHQFSESDLDIQVSIRDEHRKCQPFALSSRLGMATALSFYGDSEQVGPFMQTASHKTRAYYINANGFSGFVVKSVIIAVLTKAFEQR